MKKKISFSSSSFLIDNDPIWEPLKKKFKLNFNDYRFYDQILNQEADFDVVILSFKDLIDYPIFEISKKNKNKLCNKISNIFKILKTKISTKKNPLILFIDFYYSDTNIKGSQNFPIEEQLVSFVKKKIQGLFNFSNFFYFNIDSFEKKLSLFDNRLFYISRTRYSQHCLQFISKIIEKTIQKITIPSKKVLILDCDNTLWGGVVGEDGYNGIRIGTDGEGLIFSDFQKAILRLKNEGVILCMASKNNLDDVLKVFKKNKNMVLKLEDFSSYKVNWKTKTQNIKDLSIDLDLSLNSFAFFDDNPLERDQVRKNLPDVYVVEPDIDISNWPHQILEDFEFIKFKLTKEDLLKTQQYKNRLKFVSEKNSNNNEFNFLNQIQLKAKIVKIEKSNEQRCLQIIHKTNQFNLTTKRYSQSELIDFQKNKKNASFLVDLNDKYGSHGLVAMIMLRSEKNFIYIDNFAMSCRVLGRYLEFWIFSKIKEFAKKNKINFIIGEYIPTKKNHLVKDLYKSMEFISVKDTKEIPSEISKHLNKRSKKFIVNTEKINLLYSSVYKN